MSRAFRAAATRRASRLGKLIQPPHMMGMDVRQRWNELGKVPAVRTALFVTGIYKTIARKRVRKKEKN